MAHFRIKYAAVLPRPHQTWPLVKRFWPFMRPYKRLIGVVAALMIIELPISVAAPFLVKHLIDTVVKSGDVRQLFVIGGALIGLTL